MLTITFAITQRSGTGKTNVLFQHAIAYARELRSESHAKPICFLTVSPKLKNELERRFRDVQEMDHAVLPPISFFSFIDLIERLVDTHGIPMRPPFCKFLEYAASRRSHKKMPLDLTLIGNEIGGVILGSLSCAKQQAPLSRAQYLSEIRSNVANKTEEGMKKRGVIYDEYEQYRRWKVANSKYDLHDTVLALISHTKGEDIFRSGKCRVPEMLVTSLL